MTFRLEKLIQSSLICDKRLRVDSVKVCTHHRFRSELAPKETNKILHHFVSPLSVSSNPLDVVAVSTDRGPNKRREAKEREEVAKRQNLFLVITSRGAQWAPLALGRDVLCGSVVYLAPRAAALHCCKKEKNHPEKKGKRFEINFIRKTLCTLFCALLSKLIGGPGHCL